MQVADLLQPGIGKSASLVDFLVFEVGNDALGNVAHLLHVDGEGNDVGPAAAFAFLERLAADLRQIKLDRGVQVIDDIVHLAQLFGEHAIIGLEHEQHAGQHLLDHVADAHRLAGGAANGQRRRSERRRIQVARLGGIVVIGLGRHQSLGDASDRLGEENKRYRDAHIEQQMEVHDHPVLVGIERGEQRLRLVEQKRKGDAAE